MSNALLFIAIIFQVIAVAALLWSIWNEEKLVVFERELEKRYRAYRRAKKAEKSIRNTDNGNVSSNIYYTPVKPRKKQSANSFDAA